MAFVESAEDVAKTVRFAAENGLRVSGQGTGHGAAPARPLDDDDPDQDRAACATSRSTPTPRSRASKPGCCRSSWAKRPTPMAWSGCPGSSPDVGVVGYTLGGGLSWLGRRHGFACNRLSAIELVTADGEQRTVDAENDADLFWALRGGGGGYAIVTALHVDLLPIAEIYAGALLFPAEVGAEAVRAYRDWAATVSDDVTSVSASSPRRRSPTCPSRCAARRC